VALALDGLGDVARARGQGAQAAALYEASLALRRALGDRGGIAAALYRLGTVAQAQGESARAAGLLGESLDLFQAMGDTSRMALCLEGLAGIAGVLGHAARAVRLVGTAAAWRERADEVAPPLERGARDHAMAASRSALGSEAFATEWTRGRLLALEDAIAEARAIVASGRDAT
jgi:tetratricopeptide (TPR) repeat protein